MAGYWDELGIAPTRDQASIRRAYAVRLKQIRPEQDAAGFRRLRAAYDSALAAASGVARPTIVPPRDEAAVIEPTENGQRIRAAIQRHDVVAAAALLKQARDAGELSLSEEMDLADSLLLALVNDRELPGMAAFAAATRLGWYGGAGEARDSALLRRLHARIEAERWLVKLRSYGVWWRFYLGGQRAAAARLLLGRGLVGFARLLPPEPPLRRLVAEFHLHQAWIGHLVDPVRLALLERMVTRRYTRYASLVWMLAALLPLGFTAPTASLLVFLALMARWLRRFARVVVVVALLFWALIIIEFGLDPPIIP